MQVGGRPVGCRSKKALGLFLYLAQAGCQRPRRELARLFWGADEAAARTSLRTALQRLPVALLQLLAVDRESLGLRAEGELASFRRFQDQPAQRGRELHAQLRRFLGTRAGRKVRYGSLLVDALELDRVPPALDLALARVHG